MAVIPEHHLLFDHVKRTVIRNEQFDTGRWSAEDFRSFMTLLERMKLKARDPVVNEKAFWDFFASELKCKGGVSRSPEECAEMVIICSQCDEQKCAKVMRLSLYRSLSGSLFTTGGGNWP